MPKPPQEEGNKLPTWEDCFQRFGFGLKMRLKIF
jgi:hypothetical protein